MECLTPVLQGQTVSGTRTLFERRCGYCEACRLTYRQTWSARIQLEASLHAHSSFLTLTYDEFNLPDPPQLVPKDLQLFLKRLRSFIDGKIRFFGVGEYGSRSLRPHYHLVIFGADCLIVEAAAQKAWQKGFVSASELTPGRAAYVAKYVCKDVSGDDQIPDSWQREFARMSNKPGIGYGYVDLMTSAINEQNVRQVDRGYPPITQLLGGSMMIGPVHYPVGRYLRGKLKDRIKLGNRSELGLALERDANHFSNPPDRSKDIRGLRAQARSRIRKSSGVL